MTEAEERNKEAYRAMVERAWNQRDPRAVTETLVGQWRAEYPHFVREGGRERVEQAVRALVEAIPDLQVRVEQVIAEGDTVAARWILTGHVHGRVYGADGHRRLIRVSGMSFNRFLDGKIVEGWIQWDAHGLLSQIGALPALPDIDSEA
jgi:predicted ester cyclase